MPDGILIWLILFVLFTCVFFGVAAWVSVAGLRDIRDLLKRRH